MIPQMELGNRETDIETSISNNNNNNNNKNDKDEDGGDNDNSPNVTTKALHHNQLYNCSYLLFCFILFVVFIYHRRSLFVILFRTRND